MKNSSCIFVVAEGVKKMDWYWAWDFVLCSIERDGPMATGFVLFYISLL